MIMSGPHNNETLQFLQTCIPPGTSHGASVDGCIPLKSRCGALLGEGCPAEELWLAELAARIPRKRPIFVNVGANKGYGVAEFLQLWTQRGLTNRQWYHHIQHFAKQVNSGFLMRDACGPCGQCNPRPAHKHNRDGGIAHALELSGRNRELLRAVASFAHVDDLVHVHQLVGSNATRWMYMRNDSAANYGSELGALCAKPSLKEGCSQAVRATSLDDFFDRHIGADTPVYQVLIDTEGWDGLVIEGMRRSLSARRVSLLSFEYTYKGFWSTPATADCRSLATLLSWLWRAGYTCFWQGRRHLVPANGPCLDPSLHGDVGWSTLLCAHEPEVLNVLRTFTPRHSVQVFDDYPTHRREGSHTKAMQRATIVNASRREHAAICTIVQTRYSGKSYFSPNVRHCNCRSSLTGAGHPGF